MARQPPVNICQYAQSAMKLYRVPASSQLAQWIVESGWGTHSPGNNPFGMKPRVGMSDPYQTLSTMEHINGKDITEDQPFRVFSDVEAAFLAHAQMIATSKVYAPAMAALPDVNKFIDLLAPHYATAPNYADTLKGLIRSQGLSVYDQV